MVMEFKDKKGRKEKGISKVTFVFLSFFYVRYSQFLILRLLLVQIWSVCHFESLNCFGFLKFLIIVLCERQDDFEFAMTQIRINF